MPQPKRYYSVFVGCGNVQRFWFYWGSMVQCLSHIIKCSILYKEQLSYRKWLILDCFGEPLHNRHLARWKTSLERVTCIVKGKRTDIHLCPLWPTEWILTAEKDNNDTLIYFNLIWFDFCLNLFITHASHQLSCLCVCMCFFFHTNAIFFFHLTKLNNTLNTSIKILLQKHFKGHGPLKILH